MGSFFAALTGLCGGLVVGGTVSAFLVMLGIFSKTMLALNLKVSSAAAASCAAIGGAAGTLMTLFPISLCLGAIASAIFGLFFGIYVGVFIACLAEVVNITPLLKNSGLSKCIITLVLIWFVAGKLAGSLIYWISDLF